ncbi:MAG: multidrug efflux transporter [Gammaproteobacteria bacterium]|jgi:hydrophobe/amphiphile efflux-1 (HAE1) family protein|nr:multidrug efflux transporter [Gammaproteobacteria bacterium]
MNNTSFTDIFIRRPVLATVVSLIIFLTGLFSFSKLPLRQFPVIASNVINIEIKYPGADPNLVENFITTPVENAMMGIDGVDYMTSQSSQSESNITINFKLGSDMDKANSDVSNAVSSVKYRLPQGILDPVITAVDPNANPVQYIAFRSTALPETAVGDYLNRSVKPILANLPDVGSVSIWSNTYAMRLWLDPQKMAAKDISPLDVQSTISSNNVQGAFGQLQPKYQLFNIVGNTDLRNAEQFNNLPVKLINGQLVRVKDVGHAELGSESYNVTAYVNGQRASVVPVTPTATGNPLTVSTALTKALVEIQGHLPSGITVKTIWDTSKFIRASLDEVVSTLLIAAACVLAVIFFFLGSWRSVIIPIVTIPLALFGVATIMLALNYTLNTLTFLAWVLAIGLVVDDAIVVVENISRHIEEGKAPFEAALVGAREISFAVIAMTLTLAAVYAPIGFTTGLTGILFREFAFTLASAVIVSGVIALTLSPMLCSRLLVPIQKESFATKIDAFFDKVKTKYHNALIFVLHHPKYIVATAIIIYSSAVVLYKTLPSELAPTEDQGAILTAFQGPTSANSDYMRQISPLLGKIYDSVPEREDYGTVVGVHGGVNTGLSFLTLKPWHERKRNSTEIISELMPKMWAIPGFLAFPFNMPSLPGSTGNNPISFVLKTTGSWESLESSMQTLLAAARKNPNLTNLNTDLKTDQLSLVINIDRDKANTLGINMADLSSSLSVLLGDPISGYFNLNGRSYQVIPQIYDELRQNPSQLEQVPIRTMSGQLVPLGSFASFTQTTMPQSLPHFQQLRAITLSGDVAPGYTLGQALNFLKGFVDQNLSKSITVDYSDQSRQFMDAQGAMGQVFGFAVIFIFLVLSAQFESFRNPLIVMLSVPLSLFGALLAMHLTKCTMNIFTEIGLVTLIGLISKHGILIVEFAEQIQETGKSVFDAVLESATLRLRAILMTTGAMILGAVPLVLADGAGSEARRQLGWVIIAGMGIGTCFTLFVIPTMYTLIAKNGTGTKEPS